MKSLRFVAPSILTCLSLMAGLSQAHGGELSLPYAKILDCQTLEPCRNTSVCNIEVFASSSDWLARKTTLRGFAVWQQSRDAGLYQDKIAMPAELSLADKEKIVITTRLDYPGSTALTTKNVAPGETSMTAELSFDGKRKSPFQCFRLKDPK